MKKTGIALLSAAYFTLSGCAAMFHGTSEQVSIYSHDSDTQLFVNGAYVGRGNAVTTLKKSNDYVISARKEGCHEANIPAPKSFDGITLLGVLIDLGLISVLVVDGAATGAWQKFDQTSYVLDPHCPKAA